MNKEYSDQESPCCDATEHRPAGSDGPWFCMACGKARKEDSK